MSLGRFCSPGSVWSTISKTAIEASEQFEPAGVWPTDFSRERVICIHERLRIIQVEHRSFAQAPFACQSIRNLFLRIYLNSPIRYCGPSAMDTRKSNGSSRGEHNAGAGCEIPISAQQVELANFRRTRSQSSISETWRRVCRESRAKLGRAKNVIAFKCDLAEAKALPFCDLGLQSHSLRHSKRVIALRLALSTSAWAKPCSANTPRTACCSTTSSCSSKQAPTSWPLMVQSSLQRLMLTGPSRMTSEITSSSFAVSADRQRNRARAVEVEKPDTALAL